MTNHPFGRRVGARQDTHIRENRSTWSSQVGRPHIEQDMVVGDWHTWHIAASIRPPKYVVREEVVAHPSARGVAGARLSRFGLECEEGVYPP